MNLNERIAAMEKCAGFKEIQHSQFGKDDSPLWPKRKMLPLKYKPSALGYLETTIPLISRMAESTKFNRNCPTFLNYIFL